MVEQPLVLDSASRVLEQIQSSVSSDPFWQPYLDQFVPQYDTQSSLHLAILVEPYLEFVLGGQKTLESRFSVRRIPPYYCVADGDIVLLKRSGGPIVGLCQIVQVKHFTLNPRVLEMLKTEFSRDLCAEDPNFWKERENTLFATLMRLQNVKAIPPVAYTKRDRRGWIVMLTGNKQLKLDLFGL